MKSQQKWRRPFSSNIDEITHKFAVQPDVLWFWSLACTCEVATLVGWQRQQPYSYQILCQSQRISHFSTCIHTCCCTSACVYVYVCVYTCVHSRYVDQRKLVWFMVALTLLIRYEFNIVYIYWLNPILPISFYEPLIQSPYTDNSNNDGERLLWICVTHWRPRYVNLAEMMKHLHSFFISNAQNEKIQFKMCDVNNKQMQNSA